MANEIEKRNEAFLIYQDENGIARVNVRFEGEDTTLSRFMPMVNKMRNELTKNFC